MAEVFEAELAGHAGFVRRVAIKRMLESAAADPGAAKRFLDEATIASRLHHANVISVVDLGLLDDRPFQVLEFVDGIDAQRLLQRAGGTLPLEVALAITAEVAHALDHAHSAVDADGHPLDIVHRDVKPSNVLLSWGGDVKLGDFGIAVARDRAAVTEAGVVAGTMGFIAPEQRTRAPLDGRTDVFSLGLTLHALATGSSPLSALEVEIEVLAGTPVPIDPALPAEVRDVLSRALALSRIERPTAGEFAAQLGSLLAPRLTRDGRSLLRDFLAPYANRPASKPGALDALLGIEVVMTGSSRDEVARYETRAVSTSDKTPTVGPPERATTPYPRDGITQPTERVDLIEPEPPRRRRIAPIAAALLIAGGIGGVAVWKLSGSAPPVPDAAVASIDAAADTSRDAPVDDIVTDIPLPIDTLPIDAAVDARPPARDARTPAADAAVAVQIPDAAPTGGTGYIQVLGEDLIGASVIIDGRNVGSVPNAFPVGFGSHRVEVEKRDGTRLPARVVEVTATHNRANPVHPSW